MAERRLAKMTPSISKILTIHSDELLPGGRNRSISRMEFRGRDGDDIFRGLQGNDVFKGGPGDDIYLWRASDISRYG